MPFITILSVLLALVSPPPEAVPTPSPQRVLGLIRSTFRSHRPPPPYVAYTLIRAQKTEQGYPDLFDSYTYHIWCRNLDRAAMGRRVYRDLNRGDMEFQRPAFNEARDPGPPTADVFEPAPLKSRPIEFVPTPEPSAPLRTIGSISAIGEFDYAVRRLAIEGDEVHVSIEPTRDPERNRLREIWADKTTYELHKLVATDRLYISDGSKYGVVFTITMAMLDGRPVVASIHGTVGDGYEGDGKIIDYTFKDVTFPSALPAWYFDAKQYKGHQKDAPL